MQCPKCGYELSGSDKFCRQCGEKVASDENICKRCGKPISGRFCSNCGMDSQAVAPVPISANITPVQEEAVQPVYHQTVIYQQAAPAPQLRPVRGQLRCPRCGGTSIQAIDASPAGTRTSLNVNPFHPLTVFNTKRRDKRLSGAKVGAAFLTGGMSAMVTGLHTKVGVKVFCLQCGHTWEVRR